MTHIHIQAFKVTVQMSKQERQKDPWFSNVNFVSHHLHSTLTAANLQKTNAGRLGQRFGSHQNELANRNIWTACLRLHLLLLAFWSFLWVLCSQPVQMCVSKPKPAWDRMVQASGWVWVWYLARQVGAAFHCGDLTTSQPGQTYGACWCWHQAGWRLLGSSSLTNALFHCTLYVCKYCILQ